MHALSDVPTLIERSDFNAFLALQPTILANFHFPIERQPPLLLFFSSLSPHLPVPQLDREVRALNREFLPRGSKCPPMILFNLLSSKGQGMPSHPGK